MNPLTPSGGEDIRDNTLNFTQAKAITSGNPLVLEKAVADQELARLSRLDRAYNRNLVALNHTQCGEQSAADAAAQDPPLIPAAVGCPGHHSADGGPAQGHVPFP